ncbi:homeodomain-interacting protein kinase 1-like isoform X2 [Clinocottus analis]|uniref:homeodomain-interacting protein kinase 1-like isoform X2 n=1 Tax=Clinocottus analis TaxID=304258 RepID=UPI0035C1BA11
MSSRILDASGVSVTLTAPEVQAGQTLFSSSSGYSVLEFIGEGCFGKVAKCRNLTTQESVAVKIIKQDDEFIQDTEKEVSMLEVISVLNPDLTNVVKFFERFEHMGQTCLAFEILDMSLYDMVGERDGKPLALNEIRPIAKQLLVALDALKGLGILHTDIKPDNIMFVNMQDQHLKIKLIDFGEAIPASKIQPGMALQPTGYRAPEVALGLPFTEAIDVWGVGCILAFLYLADNIFPVNCDYQMMKCMVEILGQPDDHLLCAGIHTQCFFIETKAADHPLWRLMMPEEYMAANNMKAGEQHSYNDLPRSLDQLVDIYPKGDVAEFEDRKAFVNLIKQLLHLDGDQRISPRLALQNLFITKSNLTEHTGSKAHLNTSGSMVSICPMEDSADTVNTSAANWADWCSDEGLPPSTNQEDPASWSPGEGLPPSTHHEDPPIWSSDKRLSPSTFYEDPALWSPDEGLSLSNYYEDPALWFSDEELSPSNYDEDPALWSPDEGLSPSTYYENPAFWSPDEELSLSNYYDDPAPWSPDKGLSPSNYYEDPAYWSSDEELLIYAYDADLAAWSSDGQPCSTYREDPTLLSPGEVLHSSTYHKDPVVWSPGEVLHPYAYYEDPAVLSSDEGLLISAYDADPATRSSDRGLPPYCDDKNLVLSYDGAKPTGYTAAPSAGHPERMSIRKFLSQIMATRCCCCSPNVEV